MASDPILCMPLQVKDRINTTKLASLRRLLQLLVAARAPPVVLQLTTWSKSSDDDMVVDQLSELGSLAFERDGKVCATSHVPLTGLILWIWDLLYILFVFAIYRA